MDKQVITGFVKEIESELTDNILQFWIDHTVDKENGGFYGFMSDDLTVDKEHCRSAVLYSRILWTFSTAYRYFKEDKYLGMANRAYDYIKKYFIDRKNSGVFWLLDYKGNVLDSKKQTYAIAFTIYGMSEFYRATGSRESLDKAIALYKALENHVYDKVNKGYIEAKTMDWQPISNMSLSSADMNVSKSMNTHLHVLESYTNLYRVWKDEGLKSSLHELINVIIDKIIDTQKYQFKLFFDDSWKPLSSDVSFGHDIEGSWLLYEAAEVLGSPDILNRVREISVNMARKVISEGIDSKNGGLFYHKSGQVINDYKEWWPQAESVVGFSNAYQLTGEDSFMEESLKMWSFIKEHFVDRVYGEWLWGSNSDGSYRNEKVGPWKCPYHNSRMCFEISARFGHKES
jgi:mannobiose 2-epimerase